MRRHIDKSPVKFEWKKELKREILRVKTNIKQLLEEKEFREDKDLWIHKEQLWRAIENCKTKLSELNAKWSEEIKKALEKKPICNDLWDWRQYWYWRFNY